MIRKHDVYGLDNARLQALYSKDPSTKVGAAILRPDGTIASVGRNGFPQGIEDSIERLENRETKIALTIHAEDNAILLAAEKLAGYTIYIWPWLPCSPCSAKIIQAKLARVVTIDRKLPERWVASMKLAEDVLVEAGVEVEVYDERAYLGASKLHDLFD